MRRFVDRELLALLAQAGLGRARLTAAKSICPPIASWSSCNAPTSARTACGCRSKSKPAGWWRTCSAPVGSTRSKSRRASALANAMSGFYAMAGVNLVREQMDAVVEPLNAPLRDSRRLAAADSSSIAAGRRSLRIERLAHDAAAACAHLGRLDRTDGRSQATRLQLHDDSLARVGRDLGSRPLAGRHTAARSRRCGASVPGPGQPTAV